MADFPATIFEQREMNNIPGMTYDPEKKTTIYMEDLKNLGDEVTAIETYLSPVKETTVDIPVLNLFAGTPLYLGEGGECKCRFMRIGNLVQASIQLVLGEDYEDFEGVFCMLLEGILPPISYVGTVTGSGAGGALVENVALNKTDVIAFAVTDAPGQLMCFGVFSGNVSGAEKLVGNQYPIEIGVGWYMAGNFSYWTEED